MPDGSGIGHTMYGLIEELYPICRSITGAGVRDTLRIVERHLGRPLAVTEIPTGTPLLDWTAPKEWNIRDAWIADSTGKRVVDFRRSNLHVMSYSVPVRARLSLDELLPHLFTLPERPDWIPYRTSYHDESWGFCLSHRQLEAMRPGAYDVLIDATLEPGHLTYGELVLPGELSDEVLFSTHVCHPSLCNDNLSAIAVSVALATEIAARPQRRFTYRFVYAPGTIGAIAWLEMNRKRVGRVRAGMTLVCLGDASKLTYKRTLDGAAMIDRAAALVLRDSGMEHDLIEFFPYGYDERQYNSPGFRVPVGSLMRGRHGQFSEYHTSADDLSFVSSDRLAESLAIVRDVVEVLEGDRVYVNLAPEGEPQLGRRGLYRSVGGTDIPNVNLAMLWVLSLSDGTRSLVDVAERAQMPFRSIRKAADLLLGAGLLRDTASAMGRS